MRVFIVTYLCMHMHSSCAISLCVANKDALFLTHARVQSAPTSPHAHRPVAHGLPRSFTTRHPRVPPADSPRHATPLPTALAPTKVPCKLESMGISDWTAAEWGSFLTAAGAALVLLVKTCFSGMSEDGGHYISVSTGKPTASQLPKYKHTHPVTQMERAKGA